MSLLDDAITRQNQKRICRLSKINNEPQQTTIATPSGWDAATGSYIATTPDGGKIPYKAGQPSAASSSIVVSVGSNALIGFGDWQ